MCVPSGWIRLPRRHQEDLDVSGVGRQLTQLVQLAGQKLKVGVCRRETQSLGQRLSSAGRSPASPNTGTTHHRRRSPRSHALNQGLRSQLGAGSGCPRDHHAKRRPNSRPQTLSAERPTPDCGNSTPGQSPPHSGRSGTGQSIARAALRVASLPTQVALSSSPFGHAAPRRSYQPHRAPSRMGRSR